MRNEYRDRDVRNAMRDLAEATGKFDLATTGGLPEVQPTPGGAAFMVAIDPLDWNDVSNSDDPDGPTLFRTATVQVTILAVIEDSTARDEMAELLWNTLANAWGGVSLAGLTYPDQTAFTYTRWLAPKDMERRIQSKFTYTYQVGQFTDFGTNE